MSRLRPPLRIEPQLELFVLGRDPDRAEPRLAMMAGPRPDAEGRVIGRRVDCLIVAMPGGAVAAQGHQHGLADRDGVGAERERLGNIGPRADSARHNELHLADHVEFFEGFDGQAYSRQAWESPRAR